MRTLHVPTLLVGFAIALAATGCGDDGTGDDDDYDGRRTETITDSTACEQLAAKCPNCTWPHLRTTCENAVATNDEPSCQDGLTDPDIRANCN